MRISDLIIIYLACGAPFAVYYYLQNRQRLFSRQLVFKTVLNLIFWIPVSLQFAFQKLSARQPHKFAGRVSSSPESELEIKLERIQKQIEQIADQPNAEINFYDLRETLNRYIGLSLSLFDESQTEAAGERQIFEIADSKNAEIGAICLQRRNRQRLLFHQTQSAGDFARAIFQLAENVESRGRLKDLSVELANLLNDSSTEKIISDFFVKDLQIGRHINVKNAEKELWNSSPKLPNGHQISVNLNSMSRTKLQFKD